MKDFPPHAEARAKRYRLDRTNAERDLCELTSSGPCLRGDIVFWGCPYCGGTGRQEVDVLPGADPLGYRYVQCEGCALVFPWPRLNRDALAMYVNAGWMNDYLEKSLSPAHSNFRPFPEALFKTFAGCRVLEVGPGEGHLLDYLRRRGGDIWGVEPNRVRARRCEAMGAQIVTAPFDSKLLDRPGFPESFDAVLFIESLYHFFDLKETLETAHRLLRMGGRLVVQAFDLESFPIRCLREASVGINGLAIPINASANVYAKILTHSGFSVKRLFRCPGDIFSSIGLDRSRLRSRPGFWSLRVVGKAVDILLRICGQSRNFLLVAEKS